ncbi:unnamed protein product, partial [Rotaria magnacalcarata]
EQFNYHQAYANSTILDAVHCGLWSFSTALYPCNFEIFTCARDSNIKCNMNRITVDRKTLTLLEEANRLQEGNTVQVLIIGAGISGLEAARLLRQNGIKILVLEARNRTGGRIWSIRSKTNRILEMGASFIHGIDGSIPSGFLTNPVWDLVREANIRTKSPKKKISLGFIQSRIVFQMLHVGTMSI